MKPAQGQSVWLLALGQTLTYAGAYYGFAALLPDLVAQTGWTVADLAFGPTISFLVMAVMLPFAGRLVDHGHGGRTMLLGPLLAALALVGLSQAQSLWQWGLGWAVVGLAMSGSVYETCFSLLTRALPAGEAEGQLSARGAIIRVTLVAGFASTMAFPLGHWWGPILGGQGGLAAFAGVVALAVPVNGLGLRRLGRGQARVVHPASAKGLLFAALRGRKFWGLTLILSALWASHGVLMTYILVLLPERGASAGMAALAASVIGPAQVFGRLVLIGAGARVSNTAATFATIGALVLAAVLLMIAGAAPWLIFVFAAVQGAGAGLMSILRPVLVADYLGRAGFGTLSSAVSVGPVLANAAAPALGALLLARGGVDGAILACLALCAFALILTAAMTRLGTKD